MYTVPVGEKDMRHFVVLIAVCLMASSTALAQISPIQMSILPNGRSGGINEPVTYFATIVSTSQEALTCAPRFGGGLGGLPEGITGTATFTPWNGATFTGAQNAPVVIPAGGRQDYVVGLTLTREFSGPVYAFMRCENGGGDIFDVPRLEYVNDFLIRTRTGDQPDILVVSDTLSNDGVARVGSTGPRAALTTVSAINIGEDASVVWVRPEITGFSLLDSNLQTRICEINAVGQCQGPQLPELRLTNWVNGETRFFAARTFIPGGVSVPFFPGVLRLGILFDDSESLASDSIAHDGLDSPTAYKTPGVFITEIALFAPSIAEVETALPVFIGQCASRLDDDMSGLTANEGGVLAVTTDTTDEDGMATFHGYLRINDANLESYNQPIRIDYDVEGPATMHVLGTGNADQQASDTTMTVTVADVVGGVRISWPADPSAINMFGGAGSSQCSWVPPAGSQTVYDEWLSTTAGEWSCADTFAGDTCDGSVIVSADGDTSSVHFDADDDSEEDQDEAEIDIGKPPAQNVANAIVAFFGIYPNTGGDQSVEEPAALTQDVPFGLAVPSAYRPGNQGGVVADCLAIMVEGLPATEGDPQTANSDAGVFLLERPDGFINDRERIDCIP
jgi:hypothetical protein